MTSRKRSGAVAAFRAQLASRSKDAVDAVVASHRSKDKTYQYTETRALLSLCLMVSLKEFSNAYQLLSSPTPFHHA